MPREFQSLSSSRAVFPVSFLLALFFAPISPISRPSIADEVLLKNGKLIEGRVEENGDRVTIRPYGADGAIILPRDRIESITVKPRPVETKPPEVAGDAEATEAPGAASGPEGGAQEGTSIPGIDFGVPAGATGGGTVGVRQPAETPRARTPMPKIEYSYYPALDAQVVSAIETVFPRMVKVCVEELGMTLDGRVQLRIEVIPDTATFQKLEMALHGRHDSMMGFYAPHKDVIVVRGDKFKIEAVSTLYHEGSHALFSRELVFPPLWINEGVAEFFEGFRVHGNIVNVVDRNMHDAATKAFLVNGMLIPLDKYLLLTDEQWRAIEVRPPPGKDPSKIENFAQQVPRGMAWSLVTYFLTHEEGRVALRAYLRALKENQARDPLVAAYKELDATFPGGIRGLEESWHGWIPRVREPLSY